MQVQEITATKEHAARELAAYRNLVAERRTEEDEMLARCYREMAKGKTLIDVHASIVDAGLNEQGWPRLAIARAGFDFVYCQNRREMVYHFTTAKGWGDRGDFTRRGHFHHVRVTMDRPRQAWDSVRAPIPVVPFHHRPRFKLSNYHLLWEVEQWEAAPQGDPILLKHLIGPMYAVLAQWDLTPLESAVLRGRMT